jgi:hypothetical protein
VLVHVASSSCAAPEADSKLCRNNNRRGSLTTTMCRTANCWYHWQQLPNLLSVHEGPNTLITIVLPSTRGQSVKWLRRIRLLKRVDRVRLSGGIPLRRPMRCRGAPPRLTVTRAGLLGNTRLGFEVGGRLYAFRLPDGLHTLSSHSDHSSWYRPLRLGSPYTLAARDGEAFLVRQHRIRNCGPS